MHHVAGQEAVFKTKVDAKRLDSDVLHSDEEVQGGRKKTQNVCQKFLLGALFEVMAKHINTGTYSRPINGYPYLLEDSSMMSRRFSLIDVSMELNFCFTCFRGSLFNGSRKTSHTVHRLTLFLVVYTPNSFLLPSGSPHVRQELLKFLLPVYGPELKAA